MKEIIEKPEHDLISFLTLFARRLRDNGLPAEPAKVSDSVFGLRSINFFHKEKAYLVLLTIFLSKQEERLLFDRLFNEFCEFKSHDREANPHSMLTEELKSRVPENSSNRMIRTISDVEAKREGIEPFGTGASIN